MGWKNVKEHYRIEHTVHITDAGLCIGSAYVHNIIVVAPNGKITKRYDRDSDDLGRYQREIESDPKKFEALLASADTFTSSITVFTSANGEIIEKRCEKVGWPNVTHDGELMYSNTFFTSQAKAAKRAKEDAAVSLKWARENVERREAELAESRARLVEAESAMAKANAL